MSCCFELRLVHLSKDIIGDTTADWNDTRVSLLYAPNLATDASYIPNVINDVSASLGTTEDPAAALDFTQELARAVFGSTEAVDMFSNESDIASSYGTAIESCATAISNEFSSAGDKTMHSAINSNSEKKLQTVKKIYDQLRFNALGYGTPLTRFTMGFTAGFKVGTTAFDQESGLSVTREDGGATGGATVNVLMSGTTIDSIVVNTTGSGFTKEDKIYITDSNNHIIEITSITDVQASMLNGTLDSDSGTELPLLVDDYFHILLTINSNALQKDAAGGVIYDRGDQVSRTIDLHVRLQ